jgi:hypothetical protein
MRVEESIIIDRPAEAVFGFLSARTNDPVWMASVTESEWVAGPMVIHGLPGRAGRQRLPRYRAVRA